MKNDRVMLWASLTVGATLAFCGCAGNRAASYRQSSVGHVPCAPSEMQVVPAHGFRDEWRVYCGGKRYICAMPARATIYGSAQVSCSRVGS